MPAFSDRVVLPAQTITLLNADAAASITFQNRGQWAVEVLGWPSTTPPVLADFDGALAYEPGQGETKMVLADAFLGINTPVHLFARCEGRGLVTVSHG